MKYKELFSPFKIKNLELKNRIVLPAMMTKMASPVSGEVTQTLINYHIDRVKGGCGLNITEACAIDKSTHGRGYMALYEDYHKASFERLVDEVHRAGGKICLQLWHGGTVATALLHPAEKPMLTNSMSLEDIAYIVEKYGQAAQRGVESGVDAIEFHAAHSYLPHTFLSAFYNERQDHYGGSLENRARFPLEVIKEIRRNMPEDMPLFMRLGCFDDLSRDALSMEDMIQFINWSQEAGVDLIDVSRGNNKEGLIYEVPSIETPPAYNRDNFRKIREATKMPIMGVGRINNPDLANEIIRNGEADLVGIGRGQIADPEFSNKAKRGQAEDIRKCIACNTGCFDAIMNHQLATITCLRNPFVGLEHMSIEETQKPKNILIAGAGLAGMTAANILKQRGHRPRLLEASSRAGGQFVLAGRGPNLSEMEEATLWEEENLKKLGVEIEFNNRLTGENLEEIRPDELVIATGASPYIPNIPGIKGEKIYDYKQVLENNMDLKGQVLVVGGGATGIETALFLAHKSSSCTIIEMEDRIGKTLGWVRLMNQMTDLHRLGIKSITGARCSSIGPDKLSYIKDNKEEEISYDYIVIAVGPRSNPYEDLVEKCDELKIPYHIIGDASQPGLAMKATGQAMELALRL